MLIPLLLAFSANAIEAREIKTNDTKIRTERVELVYYHKDYINDPKFFSFKYNRTVMAVNVSGTFLIEIDNHLKTTVQAYRFASNEYRLFPIYFNADFCATFNANNFGIRNILTCSNVPNSCPMPKGHYYICNWTPDYTNFPPNLVTGHFKINFKTSYRSKHIMEANWYAVSGDLL